MKTDSGVAKIRLKRSDESESETLWAVRVAENQYRLDNSPFFAFGLSWQDIVETQVGPDGTLGYIRTIEKSGNRTVRIVFTEYPSTDERSRTVLEEIRKLGCSYEGMQPKLVSINVPPDVSLESLTNLLRSCSGIEWEYADPTYAEIMNARAT